MNYRADNLNMGVHFALKLNLTLKVNVNHPPYGPNLDGRTDTQTDAGNDNTRRPKLASISDARAMMHVGIAK